MPAYSARLKGLFWLVVCVLSWGGLFPVAKRTLVFLDPFALADGRPVYAASDTLLQGFAALGRAVRILRPS